MIHIILLILHFIPSVIYTLAYTVGPYVNLKSGATIKSYIKKLQFEPIPIIIMLIATPILNWIFYIVSMCDDSDRTKDNYVYVVTISIYSFICEFFYAIKLLIIWMFGLKYVFRFLDKVFSIKIK